MASSTTEDGRLRRAVEIIQDLEQRLAAHDEAAHEPIAIVGMACRLPGCESPDALWQLLADGRDPIVDDGASSHGAVASLAGLDAEFFQISTREAAKMDPRQRVALETAWEALEHAGVVPAALDGARVGVYVGASGFVAPLGDDGSLYDFTGALPGVIAGRVSFALGLHGPSMSIDTACSSALVSVHLAVRALRARECELALAGGVARVEPMLKDVRSDGAAAHLSPRGRCRTFDASADGIVVSEGCGMLVLKRLSDAERDGDAILALIRGSAIGHDGRAQGLTVPNLVAQEDVVRRALADAEIAPDDVAYVECHGTGTSLGDPIEVQALRNVFGGDRAQPLIVGSIKSNIGHTDAAAGVSALLKTILALRQSSIPANLHFETPNPHIAWDQIRVASSAIAWPRGEAPRRAGVSAFGISGTNAHVVIEEAPEVEARPASSRRAALCVLSGKTPAALDAAIARLRARLASDPALALDDVAFSLATTRTHHAHRLALAVDDRAALERGLAEASMGELIRGARRGEAGPSGRVVFVFPGQGSQWLGMGRALLDEEPVFRAALEACDRAIRAEAGWSVIEVLRGPRVWLDDVTILQPALFAVSVALAAQWRAWGVEPSAVIGHSQGEVAAACVAGALSLEDAVAVICRRTHLVKRIAGAGEMIVVPLPLAETEAVIRGYEGRVVIGVTASHRSTVISGDVAATAEIVAALAARGLETRRVKIDYASHSPQTDALRGELIAALASIQPRAPQIAMRSTVTGRWVGDGELTGAYWADNLRQRVQFAEVVDALLADGHDAFVEVSAHPVLVPALDELRADRGVAVGSLVRDGGRASLLASLGALYVRGQAIAWPAVQTGQRVALPTYPWQHTVTTVAEVARPVTGQSSPSSQSSQSSQPEAWGYALRWRAHVPRPVPVRDARWGLVEDDDGVARALAEALTRAGVAVVVVPPAAGLDELLARDGLAGVICTERDEGAVLAWMRALAGRGAAAPKMWVVTRGAIATADDDPPSHPARAVIWGLGRSFALEHPAAWHGLIDLPGDVPCEMPAIPTVIADQAVACVLSSGEDQLAVRAHGVVVPRLIADAPRASGARWTTAGAALITGGLGGLGLAVAHWLIDRGVRQLVLTSRRGPDGEGARAAVAALEARGADVRVACADVTDRAAMAAAVAGRSITAVFHAAGIPDGTPIEALDAARLAEVVAAKRAGTEVLMSLARDWTLDAFVGFASCSGVWGHGGQAAYAAANAYLDAWAVAARAAGIPATTIAWGRWAGEGLGNHAKVEAFLARRGFRAMAPAKALAALERALVANTTDAVIADIDWAAFRAGFEARGPRPLLAELPVAEAPAASSAETSSDWRAQLAAMAPEARRAALVDGVRREVVRVLGTDKIDDARPFRELGLDSLMAVELKNALGRRLALALPTTLAFDHDTVRALADHLAQRLTGDDEVERAWPTDRARGTASDDARVIRLARGQERLWFLDRLAPDSAQYNELFGVRIADALDLEVLRASLGALVRRHEMLRTTFPELAVRDASGAIADEPRALIASDGPVVLEHVTLAEDDAAALIHHAELVRDRPFDLARGPLWRVLVATLAGDHHVVLFAMHHIITDGTSRQILAEELAQLVRAGGDPSVLPAQAFDFSDFVADERRRVARPAHAAHVAWWRERLAGLPRLELPYCKPNGAPAHAGGAIDVPLSPAIRAGLREVALREGFTIYELLLAAWTCVLQRYAGERDVAIGMIVANRRRSELERMLGFFVNTLVLRCDLAGEELTFAQLVRRLATTVRDADRHGEVDFAEIVRAHGGGARETRPIVQATLNLLPAPAAIAPGWAWADERTMPRSRTAKFELALELVDHIDGLQGRLEYAADSFDRAMAAQLAHHFEVLLAAAIAAPHAAIAALPLLDADEQHALIVARNATARPLAERCIHHLIEAQAQRSPDAVALVDERQQLTYRELEARANQLARYLVAEGAAVGVTVGPGAIVGLCLERSVELLVSLVAVLKTGAAYLPLDPAYPPERLAFLLEDARAALLVSNGRARSVLGATTARVIDLDVEADAIACGALARPACAATSADRAYVIYTSGSTGKPKGVEIGHRSLVNLVEDMAEELAVGPGDEMLAITSLSFDLSVPDVYLPLTRGATCRLVSRTVAADGYALAALLERATLMQATPSTWHMLLEAGWTGSPRLRAVCGGEAYTWQLATQLVARTARVWNCYGPTETTVWSTMWPIDPAHGSVILGRAIANTRLYVLDAQRAPVPVGVAGELYIAGAGLAHGYLARPALTAERFVPDPFAVACGGEADERMYRTGDRVQWNTDGTLAFLDRRDLQVKVRGFRIELGEIETVLDAHPAIARGAVVAERAGLDARLVGYYVVRDGHAITDAALRAHLKASLPDQMIPSLLVALPALPLTPNGKLDRRALAVLERPREVDTRREPVPARDAIEGALANVWREVLGVPAVDLERTFFDQGGTSLLLVRVQRLVLSELGRKISVAELFAYPSIELLAAHLRSKAEPPAIVTAPPIVVASAAAELATDHLRRMEALSVAELSLAVRDSLRELLSEEP